MDELKTQYNEAEFLICLASHLMEDGSTAFVGTGIPMLAAALAKRTHAPNLLAIFEFGGTGTSLKQLPPGVGDSRTFRRLRLDSSLTRRYSVCPPSQQVVMVKTPRRSHVDHVSH